MEIDPEIVKKEMKVFFEGLDDFISSDLTAIEVFYFSTMIHLRFAHNHPCRDANGSALRLTDKRFFAEKLGGNLSKMHSEENFKNNQARYYETINRGLNFMS